MSSKVLLLGVIAYVFQHFQIYKTRGEKELGRNVDIYESFSKFVKIYVFHELLYLKKLSDWFVEC
jgi:hypothetical protein